MERIPLAVQERSITGSKVRNLRKTGLVPGVVYGVKEKPLLVEMPANVFARVYDEAGENTVVDLSISGGKSMPVLIKDAQPDPVTDKIRHVDFLRIDMTKKIEATIPLVITGVSPCVKDQGGILVTSHDELEVECLPTDLVHEIAVDISSLIAFGDAIKVSDLKVPAGIEVLDEPGTVVAQVVEPQEEEIEVAAPTAPAEPELVGKKEGEEGEEGEKGEGEEAKPAAVEKGKEGKGGKEKSGKEKGGEGK